jgi:hypothetical protein
MKNIKIDEISEKEKIIKLKESKYYKEGDSLYSCILCEELMIDNDRIICPFCNIEICEKCFQYSIMMELRNPICIYCKKNYSLEFILSNNDTVWCKKKFLPFLGKLLMDIENKKIPNFIEKYKKIEKLRELEKEIKKYLKSNDYELVLSIDKEIKEIKKKLNITENKQKKIYISPCVNNKCKGFITDKYECNLCGEEICDKCMIKKGENHKCNRNDVKSANIIKESSKPCPECCVSIYKISGCNQMFCTNCKTTFDWITLEKDHGTVHNVHYFEWLSSIKEKKDIDNTSCGDIQDIFIIISNHNIWKMNKKIKNIKSDETYREEKFTKLRLKNILENIFMVNREYNGNIIPNLINLINDKEELLIRFLDNKIKETTWKNNLIKITIKNAFNESIIEILEMYITVTSDIIRKIGFNLNNNSIIDFIKKELYEYLEFQKYFRKSLRDSENIFNGELNGYILNRLEHINYMINKIK